MMPETVTSNKNPSRGRWRGKRNDVSNEEKENVKVPSPHPYCDLDERGTLNLGNIVESLNSPISQEHAWAITYQLAICLNAILNDGDEEIKQRCFTVTKISHVLLQKDGLVHPETFLLPVNSVLQSDRSDGSNGSGKGPPRTKCSVESKLIAKLGPTIFSGLEFGNENEEECEITPELWSLLDSMASADENSERPETDDEGIERDSGESDEDVQRFTLNSVIEVCTMRASSSANGGSTATADSHYKAVCRALVAEAVELSTFLKKVSAGTHQIRTSASFGGPYNKNGNQFNSQREPEPELSKLNFTDWARLWVQVIQQLRAGVKLKKVDFNSRCPPIEYELTPYEILMDDIRAKRFELKKVMQDGALPHRIKKDAHAIILEFIRSRPPLKKAADRILGPPPKLEEGPIELLMKSIREEHKLKPAPRLGRKDSSRSRVSRARSSDMTEINSVNNNKSSCPSSEATHLPQYQQTSHSHQPTTQRRLIKADLDVLYSLNTKDEDDDDDDYLLDENKECFYGHICPDGTQSTPVTPSRRPTDPKFEDVSQIDLRRRHSISNPTDRDDHGTTMITFPFEYTNSLNVFKSLNCPRASPILSRRRAKLSHSVSKSSLQEEFFQSNHWQTAIECLSLNLEEVVHIRNVLTKAELESLPMDCSLKEDVEKGKVCFLCLKTRFSLLFGPWGNACKLCKRTVCAKCCSKMRIPTEHFAQVPVSSLSPTLSPREEEKEFQMKSLTPTPSARESLTPTNCTNLTRRKNSVGSAPTSPNMSRKSGADTDSDSGQRSISPGIIDEEERDSFAAEPSHGPRSLPTVTSISLGLMAFKRRRFGQDKTDKLKGSLMVVCHDCKAMVLQIIRSSGSKKAGAVKCNMRLELGLV